MSLDPWKLDLDAIQARAERATLAGLRDDTLALIARARDGDRIAREMRADIDRLRAEVEQVEDNLDADEIELVASIAAALDVCAEGDGQNVVESAERVKRERDEAMAALGRHDGRSWCGACGLLNTACNEKTPDCIGARSRRERAKKSEPTALERFELRFQRSVQHAHCNVAWRHDEVAGAMRVTIDGDAGPDFANATRLRMQFDQQTIWLDESLDSLRGLHRFALPVDLRGKTIEVTAYPRFEDPVPPPGEVVVTVELLGVEKRAG